jgi:ribosomal-protein-alanine N-acetyltransferase
VAPRRALPTEARSLAPPGARILLRAARESDRREFLALVRRSKRFLAPWEPRVRDPGGGRRFDRLLPGRSGSDLKYLICRRDDGAILGQFNLNNVVRGVFQNATLGYWIGAEHARLGFMTEALSIGLRHAFLDLGLHRVEINCLPKNRPSNALAKRAGFRLEGTSPRYLQIAGRWQDHARWALLVDEWKKHRAKARPRGTRAGSKRRRG